MQTFAVETVARPVLVRLRGREQQNGRVLGGGRGAAYVSIDGFVAAITGRDVPLMPNGITVTSARGPTEIAPGAAVAIAPGRIEAGQTVFAWDPERPPVWEPSLPPLPRLDPESLGRAAAARGRAIFELAGCALPARPGPVRSSDLAAACASLVRTARPETGGSRAEELGRLLAAVARRSSAEAGEAVRGLLGRGPGLTPEGDDLIAGCAATLRGIGAAVCGVYGSREWRDSLLPCDRAHRTTAISCTLLELAVAGDVAQPLGTLLDLSASPARVAPAVAQLLRLGHSTGRAYVAAVAATLCLLTPEPVP